MFPGLVLRAGFFHATPASPFHPPLCRVRGMTNLTSTTLSIPTHPDFFIHFGLESLFTSLRNDYSHASESAHRLLFRARLGRRTLSGRLLELHRVEHVLIEQVCIADVANEPSLRFYDESASAGVEFLRCSGTISTTAMRRSAPHAGRPNMGWASSFGTGPSLFQRLSSASSLVGFPRALTISC